MSAAQDDVLLLCAAWLAARPAATRDAWPREAPTALRHVQPDPTAADALRDEPARLRAAADALAPLVAPWVAREEVQTLPALPLCLRSDEALARAALRRAALAGSLAAYWSPEVARSALPWRLEDAHIADEWTLLALAAGEAPPDATALASLRQRTARRAARDPELAALRTLALSRARAHAPAATPSAPAPVVGAPAPAPTSAPAPPGPTETPAPPAATPGAPIPIPADLPPALVAAWEHLVRDGRIDGVTLDAATGHPRWSRLFARELHRWGAECGLQTETRIVNGARIFAARAAPGRT